MAALPSSAFPGLVPITSLVHPLPQALTGSVALAPRSSPLTARNDLSASTPSRTRPMALSTPQKVAGAQPRPRSAGSRLETFTSLGPVAKMTTSLGTSWGRAATPALSSRSGKEAASSQASTFAGSFSSQPRQVLSPRTTATIYSPKATGIMGLGAAKASFTSSAPSSSTAAMVLQQAWAELCEHAAFTRAPPTSDNTRKKSDVMPEAARTRALCQLMVRVVNTVTEPQLRRVLAAGLEELFNAMFRDYTFNSDPRQGIDGRLRQTLQAGTQVEESLQNAVPYFAVVQSLRDTAKDAIMRRLELEARFTGEAPSFEDEASKTQRACDEIRLREELRHSRLLAETFQARLLEVERLRITLEDEVRTLKAEKEKDEAHKKKLNHETKRLRSDLELIKGGSRVSSTTSSPSAKESPRGSLRARAVALTGSLTLSPGGGAGSAALKRLTQSAPVHKIKERAKQQEEDEEEGMQSFVLATRSAESAPVDALVDPVPSAKIERRGTISSASTPPKTAVTSTPPPKGGLNIATVSMSSFRGKAPDKEQQAKKGWISLSGSDSGSGSGPLRRPSSSQSS